VLIPLKKGMDLWKDPGNWASAYPGNRGMILPPPVPPSRRARATNVASLYHASVSRAIQPSSPSLAFADLTTPPSRTTHPAETLPLSPVSELQEGT
jgi:hypothetical protein